MRGICWLLVVLAVASCRESRIGSSGCRQDSDCGAPADFRCDVSNGVCYCRTDSACPSGQFCNGVGFCQDRAGCVDNADCGPAAFCDTTSGKCLSQGRCTTDLHCALGQVCDVDRGSCVPGCHSSGTKMKGPEPTLLVIWVKGSVSATFSGIMKATWIGLPNVWSTGPKGSLSLSTKVFSSVASRLWCAPS